MKVGGPCAGSNVGARVIVDARKEITLRGDFTVNVLRPTRVMLLRAQGSLFGAGKLRAFVTNKQILGGEVAEVMMSELAFRYLRLR